MNAVLDTNERRFHAALALAKAMLSKGLITAQEYKKIKEMFVQKYGPVLGEL